MPSPVNPLAPLQLIMLRDTLGGDEPGAHVEQLEVVFADAVDGERVAAAWATTVERNEVLRTAFVIAGMEPVTWEKAAHKAVLEWKNAAPVSLQKWLEKDRLRPWLTPGSPPWRAVCWPCERRFIWTFHHALLDGRAIARILRGFFQCLRDGTAPEPSALTVWTPPDDRTKALAERIFQQEFAGVKITGTAADSAPPSKAVRCLGSNAASRLGSVAEAMEISPATLLIWSWGQAVVRVSGADTAIVEQVRCGQPQKGKTGFTMNTLPLAIHRATADLLEEQLQEFRAGLLAMRDIETIAPYDLPPEAATLTTNPWASVVMIEHGTLAHTAAGGSLVESVTLHEWPGGSLTAAAYQFPDLRLEVEGAQNAELLERWVDELSRFL